MLRATLLPLTGCSALRVGRLVVSIAPGIAPSIAPSIAPGKVEDWPVRTEIIIAIAIVLAIALLTISAAWLRTRGRCHELLVECATSQTTVAALTQQFETLKLESSEREAKLFANLQDALFLRDDLLLIRAEREEREQQRLLEAQGSTFFDRILLKPHSNAHKADRRPPGHFPKVGSTNLSSIGSLPAPSPGASIAGSRPGSVVSGIGGDDSLEPPTTELPRRRQRRSTFRDTDAENAVDPNVNDLEVCREGVAAEEFF